MKTTTTYLEFAEVSDTGRTKTWDVAELERQVRVHHEHRF